MNAGDLFRVIDGRGDTDTDTGGGGVIVLVLVHGSWRRHQLAARAPRCSPRTTSSWPTTAVATRAAAPPTGAARVESKRTTSSRSSSASAAGPVHLAGNSYGGSIVLGVAARRPDLVCSVTAHEPPLVGIVDASDGSDG